MSVRTVTSSRRGPLCDVVAPAAVVAAGSAVLLARPFVGGSIGSRTALFAAAYLVIAAAAAAVAGAELRFGPGGSASRTTGTMPPRAVLAMGFLALGAAALASGTPVPSPWTAVALPLSLLAAIAEEALFRRVLYGQLERVGPAVAVLGSAALFALVHLPAYGTTALPVDLGAGLLFGWQRWASGTWTVPATTHAAANLLAVLR